MGIILFDSTIDAMAVLGIILFNSTNDVNPTKVKWNIATSKVCS